jgi:hypothetical protein
MKIPILPAACAAYILSVLLLFPAMASALEPTLRPNTLQTANPVIITELQTGSSSTGKSDEFIELYNTSDTPVDITGWQLRYMNASSEAQTTSLITTITPAITQTSIGLAPGAYYVAHTATLTTVVTVQAQTYEAKLSNADKVIGLFKPDPETCSYVLQDAVGWGVSAKVETKGLPVPPSDKNAERHLQRYRDSGGHYIDTNNTFYDIKLTAASVGAGATPGSSNAATKDTPDTDNPIVYDKLPDLGASTMSGCVLPADEEPSDGEPPVTIPPSTEPPVAEPGSTETPETPVTGAGSINANSGLLSLQLTEVLPNPAAPQTDAADEFVELYNPNDRQFDVSGYVIEIGTTTKRRYTFPQGSAVSAQQFKAFFSAETGLNLSNSGSQVSLLDPLGNVIATADLYNSAKEGASWARSNGTWAWSSTPTPNAANSVTPLTTKKASAAASSSKAVKTATAAKTPAAKPIKSTPSAAPTPLTSTASLSPDRPIHTGILVVIGAFAVLYGLYEYRHDLANYIYRIRNYRTARREARGKA